MSVVKYRARYIKLYHLVRNRQTLVKELFHIDKETKQFNKPAGTGYFNQSGTLYFIGISSEPRHTVNKT